VNIFSKSKKTLSVPLDSLKKKKRLGLYDELVLGKLMKYYGFEKREELLKFLKFQHIQD
jgi:hypothetical protein